MKAIQLIQRERNEQIAKHGYDASHDLAHNENGQLAKAAVYTITGNDRFYPETWDDGFKNKLMGKTPNQRLIIAGALIAAEYDRRDAGFGLLDDDESP